MLERPPLPDARIVACLEAAYSLRIADFTFLPLGADLNTAVYRAVTPDGDAYFVKLRKGDFDEIAVTLPRYYADQGIRQIIAPLAARSGQLWAALETYRLILYPFVAGQDGYQTPLSDRQWVEFGAALRRIHFVTVPATLTSRIPGETFSPRWRNTALLFLSRLDADRYTDPIAVATAAFLWARRDETRALVARAERLAQALQAHPPDFIVCHSDLHAGNLHLAPRGEIYIVDWDNPILAPKERDLMYPGGGQFAGWRTPEEEETLFYRGYGSALVDPRALAYYRYERIVTDIAIYCEQLLGSGAGGEDRAQSLKYLQSNFAPGGTIAIAYHGDRSED